MSASNLMDIMHCAMDAKIKAKPGTTTTLYQEVCIPCGYYMFVLEDDHKLSLLKSHNFASAEVTIITSKESREILKSNVDFHREHPFMREIHVPAQDEDSDGASDQITPIPIKFEIIVNSFAHIKKVRLRAKLLTKANVVAQVIHSEISGKKRNSRRRRSISSSSDSGSSRGTPSSSFTDLPKPSGLRQEILTLSPKMEDLELPSAEKIPSTEKLPSAEKHNVDVVEKDVVIIQSNTTYTTTSEGVEQNNTTQITMEHTKTVTTDEISTLDSVSSFSDKSKLTTSERGERSDADSISLSTSGVDPTEENLVYYKETTLKKKVIRKEQFPIQQKGRYYLVIDSPEKKGPISRRFSCHLTLSQGETILKESHTNDAKRKISEEFTVDTDSAMVTLELVNTNTTFGRTELQISLYMKNVPPEPTPTTTHPHLRTGEVVWAVNACEVEKKHPQKLTAKITASGSYYIVVEKVDKIFGGLREISVNAVLTEPKEGDRPIRSYPVASVVVGGVKARPMKWKSYVFIAPAGSTIDFTVESFAIVGSIIYSIRLRKVPGLTAEEERIRKMVVLFMTTFGIYYFFYLTLSVLNFIQNIGFTLHILFLSVDITLGRICFILFITWFKQNQAVLVPALKEILESIRKISRKIKHFRDMSDGGKFDILRIFKQMSREGKANDLRKWERQKLLTANE